MNVGSVRMKLPIKGREIGMKNRKDFKRKLGIEGIES